MRKTPLFVEVEDSLVVLDCGIVRPRASAGFNRRRAVISSSVRNLARCFEGEHGSRPRLAAIAGGSVFIIGRLI